MTVNLSPRRGLALLCLLAAVLSSPAVYGQCGQNEPAFPVPECRAQIGGALAACGAAGAESAPGIVVAPTTTLESHSVPDSTIRPPCRSSQ